MGWHGHRDGTYHNIRQGTFRIFRVRRVGERTREGNDLLREMVESKLSTLANPSITNMEETGAFDMTKVDMKTRSKNPSRFDLWTVD